MIQMNLIKNCVVTTEDVNLAIKAYGPDISGIKGKTTRRKPTTVIDNTVEIPEELLEIQQDLKVSMDGITVNSMKFLTTISHDLYYRTAQYVTNPVASVYKVCMKELVTIYKKGGFNITDIHCDNEFHKVMDPFSVSQTPPRRARITTSSNKQNRQKKKFDESSDHSSKYYQASPCTCGP
jgi:hypothetical protein